MITTGLIKGINISSSNYTNNKYSVELNIFQIPGDINKNNYTCLANCSCIPGQYDSYKVDDKVYVGFLNNDLSLPIILGKIYQGISSETRSAICSQTLNVSDSAKLPKNTTIGEITYKQLLNLFNRNKKIYYMHNISAQLDSGDICKFQLLNTAQTFEDSESKEISIDTIAYEFYRVNKDLRLTVDVYKDNSSEIFTGKLAYDATNSKLTLAYNNIDTFISSIQKDDVVEI